MSEHPRISLRLIPTPVTGPIVSAPPILIASTHTVDYTCAGCAKKLLKAADIEAAIMNKLAEHPECAGITYVYIKPTDRKHPDDTWTHSLISRQPMTLRSQKETLKLHDVLNQLRIEFDLLPD